MATANFSEDGKKETADQVFCSASLTAEIHGHMTFLSVLNIFLSITAFLGNALILAGLHKESSLFPPSKLLLRSLAATDLCVGLILEPLAAIVLMSALNERWGICFYASVTAYALGVLLYEASLLTLTAISVDRLLALLLGLRYRHVVTLKRTCVVVITFWVVSAVFATVSFWNSLIARWYGKIATSLCVITSIFSYTKIFLTLRHHQTQIQDQLNIARYRKAVSTALWLQLALVACYLPDIIVLAFVNTIELSSSVLLAYQYAVTLILFNSSLNPILYCLKIEEVKQAVKGTIRQILCCL